MCHKCQPIPPLSLSRKLNSKLAVKWIESSSHFLDLRSDQFCHNSVILTERPPYRDCSERNCSLVNHKNRWLSSLRPHTWSNRPRNCFKCYQIPHIVLRKKCRWHFVKLRSRSSPGPFQIYFESFKSIPIQNQMIWTRSWCYFHCATTHHHHHPLNFSRADNDPKPIQTEF